MSADLSIKCSQELKTKELIMEIENSLKILLPIFPMFKVTIKTIRNNSKSSFNEDLLGKDKQHFLIETVGYDGIVSLTFINIEYQPPYVSIEESGIWAGVCVEYKKNSWEFILAAAVAIAIAKLQNSKVIDDGCIWNRVFEQTPTEFIKSILSDNKFIEYRNEIIEKLT